MVIVVAVLGFLLALAIVAGLATIAAFAVPALLVDPTNWWGWLGLLIVAGAVLGGSRFGSRS